MKQDIKIGDNLTTIHGEKLKVLAVKKQEIKKHGEPTGKTTTMILAESGGVKCWFPQSRVKMAKKKEEVN